MWTATIRQRFSKAPALGAMVGLGLALHAATASAAPAPCGRVFLANVQNELLSLQSSSSSLRLLGEFDSGGPRGVALRSRRPIGGLAGGESLIGIDVRPSTGVLYAVGRVGAAAVGQLYTIDVTNGLATPVGARAIPLSGAAFGFDFNPVPDLIRIVSDTGQNIRVRPADGTVAGTDAALAYPGMGDPNSTRTPRVVAVAYTNPDTDPQSNTVLHDIDANRAADPDRDGDVLTVQVPPNGGVLNTVGNLGVDTDDFAAFDIGPDNDALAALRPAGTAFSRLYVVDLPSGRAQDLGQIGPGELITGLAIQVGPTCS
jgi:hypothetical protein